MSKPVTKDGLSLTVSLDKSAYRTGEEVTLSFEIKNESDKEIFIGDGFLAPGYTEAGPGRHFEVHITADGNNPLNFWSGTMTEGGTAGVRKVFRLDSGATYKGVICIFRRFEAKQATERLGGSLEDKASRKRHVFAKDGRGYAVVLRYQVSLKTHGVSKAPPEFSDQLLWKGVLDSEPIELEIRDN